MLENPIIALIFFIGLWALSALSSFLYLNKVNKRIIELKRKYYESDGYLGASVEKANKLRKVMFIIVTNNSGDIIECDYLYSFTNFAKFKQKTELIGKNISELKEFEEDKFYKAINSSVLQIQEQLV